MAVRRRGVVVLVLIAMAVVVSALGVGLLYAIVGRSPVIEDDSTLVLRPGGVMQEIAPGDGALAWLVGHPTPSVRGFVQSLQLAKRDPRITAVILRPGPLDSPYWAKVQEMRDAITDFRASGKPVVAFLEAAGDREYFLASAADRVFLVPTGSLDLTGVASYEIFLRGVLDKLGAYPDFLQIGDYKTAVNQLTQTALTPAHREMTEALNADTYAQLVRGIAAARKKTETAIRQLLDEGPFTAADALKVGLVDGLAYEDQLVDRVPQLRAGGELKTVEGADYERVTPQSVGVRPRSRIAILYASGVIASGRSGFDPGNGAVVGSDTVAEQLKRIREDDSLKAVVVRIDSPGGSSVASDVIWRALTITRDQKPDRPLITSMSDLAASGGYYIAVPGQVIVAEPGTLTGSIGIYAGKMVVSGVLDKVGVSTATVSSGRNADIFSPFSRFSPAQREKVMGQMDGFYRTFLAKVAEGRHATVDKIDAVAQGRVWTGAQAKERGLVDMLGGLDTAIAVAKERAHIPKDEDVELVTYAPGRSVYETLAAFGQSSSVGYTWWQAAWTAMRPGSVLPRLGVQVRAFRNGEPLALLPFTFVR